MMTSNSIKPISRISYKSSRICLKISNTCQWCKKRVDYRREVGSQRRDILTSLLGSSNVQPISFLLHRRWASDEITSKDRWGYDVLASGFATARSQRIYQSHHQRSSYAWGKGALEISGHKRGSEGYDSVRLCVEHETKVMFSHKQDLKMEGLFKWAWWAAGIRYQFLGDLLTSGHLGSNQINSDFVGTTFVAYHANWFCVGVSTSRRGVWYIHETTQGFQCNTVIKLIKNEYGISI